MDWEERYVCPRCGLQGRVQVLSIPHHRGRFCNCTACGELWLWTNGVATVFSREELQALLRLRTKYLAGHARE
jgi:predicted RNA-binding Zn-ribbon protein involved in translation (DUF1610 family)